MRYLSEAELEKLLSHVQRKADVARQRGAMRAVIDEALVLLLVNAGLRVTELCKLNIGDLTIGRGKNIIRVRDASPNASRAVEVMGEIAEHLRRFLRLCRKGAKADEPFFVSERGRRFGYMSLYSKVKRIGKQAKIPDLYPSVLRATYVVRLYSSQQDLRFVQRQAGHASYRTTALYAVAGNRRDEPDKAPDAAAHETATHETMTESGGSVRKVTVREQAERRPVENRESVRFRSAEERENCEACGKCIGAAGGTKIDSGQILCPDCLTELRRT